MKTLPLVLILLGLFTVAAELIYWERPAGGRVFRAGSIGAGWGLSADPKLQALMRNVLFHFGVKPGERR
ncbi:MAG: hypothetical protein ABIP48_02685 [Planctomycetota bacterium]